ncbi:hypothetical protein ABID21_001733 [Pseudorhizobium tarimense]|uniref:Transposase n=1 Tax=Pseudorhizobium tarimense TaxID=1079109 RepID=A0ABV2H5C7_9HYPH|nr:hypothetical protein [Pseudorhizobium tarimense]MCJ8518842.1 hypothetical protein [Pseudorhizobium tarimense]
MAVVLWLAEALKSPVRYASSDVTKRLLAMFDGIHHHVFKLSSEFCDEQPWRSLKCWPTGGMNRQLFRSSTLQALLAQRSLLRSSSGSYPAA